MEKFQDLNVWQKAHELCLNVYKLTRTFPPEEKFGLVSQMRRASVSVPANIAEGFKKRSFNDKANFYNIAQGSLEELRYYLILAVDLVYWKKDENFFRLADEVSRMLYSLVDATRKK